MDLSNNLKTVLDNINDNISIVNDKIPTKTSELINDAKFAPSSYVQSQVNTKMSLPNGVYAPGATIIRPLSSGSDCKFVPASMVGISDLHTYNNNKNYYLSFNHTPIQKYDTNSLAGGEITVILQNEDLGTFQEEAGNNLVDTVELQIPLSSAVTSISYDLTFAKNIEIIDMPDTLDCDGGNEAVTYHDIVFRTERDFNGDRTVYVNHAYKFYEYFDYFYVKMHYNDDAIALNANGNNPPEAEFEYSIDRKTWQSYTPGTVINGGKTVYFRGVGNDALAQPSWYTADRGYYNFSLSGNNIEIGGNIMTLLDGKNSLNVTTMQNENAYAFAALFYNCSNLGNVTKLKLPATTLAEGCYNSMFQGCTNIESSPKLPATTLANNCYSAMFSGCSNLQYINASFTSWGSNNTQYTYGWVNGVNADGTFEGNSNLPDVRGINNIPENWSKY